MAQRWPILIGTLRRIIARGAITVARPLADGVALPPALSALSLAGSSIAENSAAGTVVGGILGKTTGSTLSLLVDAGGRFAISGGNLVTGSTSTDYEAATSHSITIRETLADSANSPRDTVLTVTVSNVFEAANLGALSLAASSIAENSAAATVVGGILGKTTGSTLSLLVDAGGRFAISGGNLIAGLTATNYEAATSHSITIREVLADSANSPRDTVLTVTVSNVFEAADLGALALSASTFTIGVASSGAITGAAAGQGVSATGLPTGITIDGPARTWAYDGTGSAGSSTLNWTGSLADSANSPFSNTQAITITGAGISKTVDRTSSTVDSSTKTVDRA